MQLLIKEKDKSDRIVELNRLVMTIGFGPDCDIDLDPEITPTRLGMFIKKDNDISFKPLLMDGSLFYENQLIENMISLTADRFIDYAYFQFGLYSKPRIQNMNSAMQRPIEPIMATEQKTYAYPAGALKAYSSSMKPVAFANKEKAIQSEDIKLSEESQLKKSIQEIKKETKKEIVNEIKNRAVDKPINKLKRAEVKDILLKVLKALNNPFQFSSQHQRKQFLSSVIKKALSPLNLSDDLYGETHENMMTQILSFSSFEKLLSNKNYVAFEVVNSEVSYIKNDGVYLQAKKHFFNSNHMLWSLQALFDHYEIQPTSDVNSFQCFIEDWLVKGVSSKNNFSRFIFVHHERNYEAHRLTKVDQLFSDAIENKENILLVKSNKENAFLDLIHRLKKNFKNKTIVYLSNGLLPSSIHTLLAEKVNIIPLSSFSEVMNHIAVGGLVDCVISDMEGSEYYKNLLNELCVKNCGWVQIAESEHFDKAIESLKLALTIHVPHLNADSQATLIQSAFPSQFNLEKDQLKNISVAEE